MSCNAYSSSDESSDEEYDNEQAARKFEIAKMIEAQFKGSKQYKDSSIDGCTAMADQWSFLLDDGLFERQANFSSTADLWRHLERIDACMSKIRKKAKKGTCRLFKSEYSRMLSSSSKWGSTQGGKWVIRFSRKFEHNLDDVWVRLVLACVSGCLPRSELIAGCVLVTRKGKVEMEVWTTDDAESLPASKELVLGAEVPSYDAQQLCIRELLGVGATEKTIEVAYRSIREKEVQKKDHERVAAVRQKVQKGGTWPLLASAQKQQDDEERQEQEKLVMVKQQLDADVYQQSETPAQYAYNYDCDDDEDDAAETVPMAALRSPFMESEPSTAEVPELVDLLEPEEHATDSLQQDSVEDGDVVKSREASPPGSPFCPSYADLAVQMLDLQLAPDSESEEESAVQDEPQAPAALDLAMLRTRLDTEDMTKEVEGHESCLLQRSSISVVTKPIPVPPLSPTFERRQLYGVDESDGEEDIELASSLQQDPLAFLDVDNSKTCSPPSKMAMVLGTNPPDFSSPVMKASTHTSAWLRSRRYSTY